MSQIGTEGLKLPPFTGRHVGPSPEDLESMLKELGFETLESLTDTAVPERIRMRDRLDLPPAQSEFEVLQTLKVFAGENEVAKSYLGLGYYRTITPPAIQRNILENPGWYTAYTPYQPEIAQGRLEALLNFQTMIVDLTGMEIANASLLDEATAAAEAMAMAFGIRGRPAGGVFFISELCHPQSVAVMQTRAEPLGIRVVTGDHRTFAFGPAVFGALVQYPASDGAVVDFGS